MSMFCNQCQEQQEYAVQLTEFAEKRRYINIQIC
jgi:hypothetical protein